jgi:hypothetical protein
MKNGGFDFHELPVGCHRSGGYPQGSLRVFNFHPDITHGRERGRLGLPRDHFD